MGDREIDREVALEVMMWKESDLAGSNYWEESGSLVFVRQSWRPTSQCNHARMVRDRMIAWTGMYSKVYAQGVWTVTFGHIFARHRSEDMAICLAAIGEVRRG